MNHYVAAGPDILFPQLSILCLLWQKFKNNHENSKERNHEIKKMLTVLIFETNLFLESFRCA